VRATGALSTRRGNTDPLKSELLARDARGGFSPEVQAALRADPTLPAEIAGRLLRQHFPESLHDDILAAVGLDRDAAATAERRVRAGRPAGLGVDRA
jgi:putative restriction endonuclease